MSIGPILSWRIAPAFQGIGVASCVITFFVNIYYIVVLAWALDYLVMSFGPELPWAHCRNEWNTHRCFNSFGLSRNETNNVCNTSNAMTSLNCSVPLVTVNSSRGATVDPVIEFWERQILHLSDGIDQPGSIVWQLAVCLFVVWLLVYFSVWRGVRWSGKVVYFTALFPYVILTCLLVRGVTLDGAADGLRFYLKPDLSKLGDAQVWIDGGTQIFFSYAIGFGVIVTMGSYNKFNNNFYRHSFIVASVNICTSFFGGFAVFSVLGFMAKEQNATIADVAESGPGLVFIAYPKAITQMPLPQFWAVLFFFMILLIGVDSQMYKVKNRMLATGLYCGVSFLIGLSMVTEGGIYVFQLFDYYSASGLVLLWVVLFESLVVGWCFGADKFYDSIELMIGTRITAWFKLCWKFVTPAITLAVLLFITIKFAPVTYNKTYVYPAWSQTLGLCMAAMSMVCIPIVFLYQLARAPCSSMLNKFRYATTPVLRPHQIPGHWKAEGYRTRSRDQFSVDA